jgi:integrase
LGRKKLHVARPDDNILICRTVTKDYHPVQKRRSRNPGKSVQNEARQSIVLLLVDTGIRVSEMCRIKVGDYNQENGLIIIRPIATGKKSRSRIVRLGKQAKGDVLVTLRPERICEKKTP